MQVLVSVVIAADAPAADYSHAIYAAPDGSDANPGTLELPLQTLEEARLRVRNHKSTVGIGPGGIAVYLRDGSWIRSSSFMLSAEDGGGDPDRPVVWRAFPGETARVLGAAAVDPTWFVPVTSGDSEWSRLATVARGQVLRTRLSDHGITDYGLLRFRGGGERATGALELFVDGVPMPLARWPDPDQHTAQSQEEATLTIYGTTVPDVSGGWTAFGTHDGVNAYVRDQAVDGVTYYLYRRTWWYDTSWHTAWFLSAEDDKYPGNAHPWWYLYNEDLGTLAPATPQTDAEGNPTIIDPAAVSHGFAAIETALSDTQFTMANTRVSRWATAPDPWFFGFWKYHWADKHVAATSINPSTRTITLAQKPGYGIADGMPFIAENLLEEITRPGEWYLERSSGYLYFWPDGSLDGREIMVSMVEEPLVQVWNAEHLRFEGLTFGVGRNDLVVVENGSDVTFDRCRFFGAGNDGIRLTGENHGVTRSEVVDTGDRGVVLSGGDRPSLTAANNFVENTEIHRVGRWSWTYMPGIQFVGVGNRASHNHIHDAPHSAILFRGNQHLIELNEIDDVCRWSSDAGAIYCGPSLGLARQPHRVQLHPRHRQPLHRRRRAWRLPRRLSLRDPGLRQSLRRHIGSRHDARRRPRRPVRKQHRGALWNGAPHRCSWRRVDQERQK